MSGLFFQRQWRKLSWLLPLVFLKLQGCGSFSDIDLGSKVDYRSAGKAPSLEVPPDLNKPEFDQRYVVAAPDAGVRPALNEATRNKLLPVVENARLERSAGQRWLVVQVPPGTAWKTARDFWQKAGFTLSMEQPELGIMETDWAENRAKIPQDIVRRTIGKVFDFLYATGERDKFRTRIEPGLEAGTAEIYITHRGMVEVGDSASQANAQVFRWQPRPPDPELEVEMLRRLLLQFGFSESHSQTVVTANPAPMIPNAPTLGTKANKIEKDAQGSPFLVLEDSFDRAWRRIGLALDRVGFTVVDRDRSKGLYFVRYANVDRVGAKQEEPGFWSKLAFWRSSEDEKSQPEQYRVNIQEQAGKTMVVIQSREGIAEKSELASQMLTLLQGQL